MRRADRQFAILQFLRREKIARAADIAQALELSRWTIYRDIRDLMVSGLPIAGEAGTGYILRPGFDLPLLMFDERETAALLLGRGWSSHGPTRSSPAPPATSSPKCERWYRRANVRASMT